MLIRSSRVKILVIVLGSVELSSSSFDIGPVELNSGGIGSSRTGSEGRVEFLAEVLEAFQVL